MKVAPPIHVVLPTGEGYITEMSDDDQFVTIKMMSGETVIIPADEPASLYRRSLQ